MNRTLTKAVDGKTLFEAVFGKKPDSRNIHEWGETMWVLIEGGTKLGGCVHEGQWIGVNKQSKGVRVYWLDKKSIMVERNVYYNKMTASASCLEGEIDEIVKMKTDTPAKPFKTTNGLTSSPAVNPPAPATPPHISTPPPALTPAPEPTKEEPPAMKCI